MRIGIGKSEIFIGRVRGKPHFILHLHKGWWWIRLLSLQLEKMDKRLAPHIKREEESEEESIELYFKDVTKEMDREAFSKQKGE